MGYQESVAIGDFGVSRPLTHAMELVTTMVGTPCYLSPEVPQCIVFQDVPFCGTLQYRLLAQSFGFQRWIFFVSYHILWLAVQVCYFAQGGKPVQFGPPLLCFTVPWRKPMYGMHETFGAMAYEHFAFGLVGLDLAASSSVSSLREYWKHASVIKFGHFNRLPLEIQMIDQVWLVPITVFQIQGVAPTADKRFLLARHGLGLIPVPRRLRKVEDSLTNCRFFLLEARNQILICFYWLVSSDCIAFSLDMIWCDVQKTRAFFLRSNYIQRREALSRHHEWGAGADRKGQRASKRFGEVAQRTKSGCGFCLPLASGPRDTCAGKRSGRQVIACLEASYSWVIIWDILNRLCCVSLHQKIIVFAGSLPDSSTTFQELREIELYESRA